MRAVSLQAEANGRTLAGDGRGVRGRLRELRIYREDLLGAAFAGYEDANALDHLGGRAGSLGQKDIGGAGAVEGVDGAGDDHGRQAGMMMLGAADEFVAVHLRHEQVAEKKIERAGGRLVNDIERLLRAVDRDDAVATGLK